MCENASVDFATMCLVLERSGVVRMASVLVRYGCLISVLGCLLFSGCYRSELEKSQARLAEVEAEMAKAAAIHEAVDAYPLVHIVWLKMKDDASPQDHAALIAELEKLAGISEVKGLEIGRFHELGDSRAMSDLDLVMQMRFSTEDEYRTYQDHPIHLQLKKDIGKYLGGPPVTYDYWTESD